MFVVVVRTSGALVFKGETRRGEEGVEEVRGGKLSGSR
jgi:hypothetical protein